MQQVVYPKNQVPQNMLVRTVGIHAIQAKASADGVARMAGAVAWVQSEMDVMDRLVEKMDIYVL